MWSRPPSLRIGLVAMTVAVMVVIASLCVGAFAHSATAFAEAHECDGPGCDDTLACGPLPQPEATSAPAISVDPNAATVSVGTLCIDAGAGLMSAAPPPSVPPFRPSASSAPRSPPSA